MNANFFHDILLIDTEHVYFESKNITFPIFCRLDNEPRIRIFLQIRGGDREMQ